MTARYSFTLAQPANDMVQEEIVKQVAHVSRDIAAIRFDGPTTLSFEVPPSQLDEIRPRVEAIAVKVQRGLRSLQRVVAYRSSFMDSPRFADRAESGDGIVFLGRGQALLRGNALRLFSYFDRVFAAVGREFEVEDVRVPTLIPTSTLARCDYFRSFPHLVTFATHLTEDAGIIEDFRARHATLHDLDAQALSGMTKPEAGLSPAVCYHTYAMHAGEELTEEGVSYGVCGKCFRYEASEISDLRRLWDFTMREIVFMGSRDLVLEKRRRALDIVSNFLEAHEIAAEIRTASDPFFIAPDAVAKTYFQLSSDTKYEISAVLPGGARLAVGSLNHHSDFFGRAFDVSVRGAGAMHSVCVAFGLERWVHAFLAQHGSDVSAWPRVVRNAMEFA